jgi:hypothetical protein
LGNYLLVSLSSPCIHSNVSAPSFDEKKAAHLGHLTPVAFDDSFVVQAHPKQNKDMTAIMQKIITQYRIEMIPSFLSYSFFAIMREILRSINPSKKLSRTSFQPMLKVFKPFVILIESKISS